MNKHDANHKEIEQLYNNMTEDEMLSSDPECIEKRMKLVQYYLQLELKNNDNANIYECDICFNMIDYKSREMHNKTCKKDKKYILENIEKNNDVQCEFCKSLVKPQSLKKHLKSKKCLKFQEVYKDFQK